MDAASTGNSLLDLLRPADFRLISASLAPVTVAAGDILYEPGDDVRFVHFPTGPALLSFLVMLEGGSSVETALIGREGALGGIVSQGHLPAYASSVVQYPGTLLRMETRLLEAAKAQSTSLGYLFSRYADCLVAQIFQSVACGAAHSVEQRTARWLLAAQDRTEQPVIPVTQERLSQLLGVGRSYVSRVVSALKAEGAIAVGLGRIRITDRDQLERHACTCTAAVRHHFDQVLKNVYPPEATG